MNILREVPVVEVNNLNLKQLWPGLMLAIKHSTFIALDTELSGLGCKKLLHSKNIEDRYKNICETATSRSVLALGISCFKRQNGDTNGRRYTVQTFNILTMCMENYIIEPSSVQFLIDHGFDFNKQFKFGLPYVRGDKEIFSKSKKSESSSKMKTPTTIQQILNEIILNKSKLVLHNALIDLIFIYGNFYGQLPTEFSTFVTDLDMIFGGGIYDTKFIAEFKMKMSTSFLEYVFKKCKKENFQQCEPNSVESGNNLMVEFLNYSELVRKNVVYITCESEKIDDNPKLSDDLCFAFKHHGWCASGLQCPKSHSVDRILDEEDNLTNNVIKRKNKKRKKNKSSSERTSQVDNVNDSNKNNDADDGIDVEKHSNHNMIPTEKETSISSPPPPPPPPLSSSSLPSSSSQLPPTSSSSSSSSPTGIHRAGFDAFMTGYIFATFIKNHRNNNSEMNNNNDCNGECGDAGNDDVTAGSSSDGYSNGKMGNCGDDDGSRHIPAHHRHHHHPSNLAQDNYVNKIYLAGKSFALQISKSSFAKPSKFNLEKLDVLRNSTTTAATTATTAFSR